MFICFLLSHSKPKAIKKGSLFVQDIILFFLCSDKRYLVARAMFKARSKITIVRLQRIPIIFMIQLLNVQQDRKMKGPFTFCSLSPDFT